MHHPLRRRPLISHFSAKRLVGVHVGLLWAHLGARAQLALQKGSHILAVQVIRHKLYKDAIKDPSEQQQIQTTDAKSKLIKITEALR